MRTSEGIASYLGEVGLLIDTVPQSVIQDVVDTILTAYTYDRSVYIIGGAGSAATASVFAANLMRRTIHRDKPRLRALALTNDAALILGLTDQYGYPEIYAQQLCALLQPGDVLIAFSSGGNTQHLRAAFQIAAAVGAVTVWFTGRGDVDLMGLADHCVSVPSGDETQTENLHFILSYAVTSVVGGAIAQTVLKPKNSSQSTEKPRVVHSPNI